MSVITDTPFVATGGEPEPAFDAGHGLTPDELVVLATRAVKRPEAISVDEIRILAASVLTQATGQAA